MSDTRKYSIMNIFLDEFTWIPEHFHLFVFHFLILMPVVTLFGWLAGYLYLQVRNRSDRATKDWANEALEIASTLNFPANINIKKFQSKEAQSLKLRWYEELHKPSIKLKNTYYRHIGFCGVMLALAMLTLALSVTLLRPYQITQTWISTVGLIAIGLLIFQWWRALCINSLWVNKRVISEFMRSWIMLTFVSSWSDTERLNKFDEKLDQISSELLPNSFINRILLFIGFAPSSEDIEKVIGLNWNKFKDELHIKYKSNQNDNTLERIIAYIYFRPLKQYAWFSMRRQQILLSGRQRGNLVFLLFFTSFALAALGTVSAYGIETLPKTFLNIKIEEWITFFLLIISTISAAMTYLYLSRNERSLYHRYETQRRQIEGWLKQISINLQSNRNTELHTLLSFEEIMVSEIKDWAHITSHDTAELGV